MITNSMMYVMLSMKQTDEAHKVPNLSLMTTTLKLESGFATSGESAQHHSLVY